MTLLSLNTCCMSICFDLPIEPNKSYLVQWLHHFLLTRNKKTNKWTNREFSSELGQRGSAKVVLKRQWFPCPTCGCKGDTSLEHLGSHSFQMRTAVRWQGTWKAHQIGGTASGNTCLRRLSTWLTCKAMRLNTELCPRSEILWFQNRRHSAFSK